MFPSHRWYWTGTWDVALRALGSRRELHKRPRLRKIGGRCKWKHLCRNVHSHALPQALLVPLKGRRVVGGSCKNGAQPVSSAGSPSNVFLSSDSTLLTERGESVLKWVVPILPSSFRLIQCQHWTSECFSRTVFCNSCPLPFVSLSFTRTPVFMRKRCVH